MNLYYFSHCRTAIKYGLKNIINEGDSILVPDFICESAIHPLLQLNLKIIYYNINEDLKINWNDLKSKNKTQAKILFIVNFLSAPS